MAFPLVPALIVGLLGGGAAVAVKRRKRLTAERKLIFESAMTQLKDGDDLRFLADVYEKEGLTAQAEMLRGRAKLRELPPDVKQARRNIFYEALGATDPVYVNKIADAFEKEHATGAAAKLREYADGLKKSGTATPGTGPAPAANTTPATPPPATPKS